MTSPGMISSCPYLPCNNKLAATGSALPGPLIRGSKLVLVCCLQILESSMLALMRACNMDADVPDGQTLMEVR